MKEREIMKYINRRKRQMILGAGSRARWTDLTEIGQEMTDFIQIYS